MFLRARKTYWLLPILVLRLFLGVAILTRGSAVAPFVRTF